MNEVIQEMNIFDLIEVMRIEEESFVKKWSMNDFLYELIVNEKAKYFVYKMNNKIIAYIGEWHLEDEIHIANLSNNGKSKFFKCKYNFSRSKIV